MPVLSSDKIAGVDIVLESITGLDEETHGLLLSVAPDGKSFSITGTPSLESFRKDGATAQSTFELTLRYVFTGIEMPSDRPVLEKKSTICHQSRPPESFGKISLWIGTTCLSQNIRGMILNLNISR